MPDESIAAKKEKKPYGRPSFVVLDAAAAKAKLKAMGDPNDEVVRAMLAFKPKRSKSSAFAKGEKQGT